MDKANASMNSFYILGWAMWLALQARCLLGLSTCRWSKVRSHAGKGLHLK